MNPPHLLGITISSLSDLWFMDFEFLVGGFFSSVPFLEIKQDKFASYLLCGCWKLETLFWFSVQLLFVCVYDQQNVFFLSINLYQFLPSIIITIILWYLMCNFLFSSASSVEQSGSPWSNWQRSKILRTSRIHFGPSPWSFFHLEPLSIMSDAAFDLKRLR